jgi:GlpG protein
MIIVTFSEKRPALAFSDYLRSQGIANRIEPKEEGFAVALDNADDGPRALAEAEGFVRHPEDPRYWQASWHAGEVQSAPVYTAAPPMAVGWWQRAGVVTRGVALLCVGIYLAMLFDGRKGEAVFGLLGFPAALGTAAIDGEWWRLLTPAFMHGNELHILFNLLWWWELGSLVERFQSPWRLLALTLVIALVSNAAQFLAYGPEFLGLSAVVYGLVGYLWLYPAGDPGAPFRLQKGIVIFLIGWLAFGYTGIVDALFGIRISNHGHLAGLIVGGALGLLLGLVNRRQPADV